MVAPPPPPPHAVSASFLKLSPRRSATHARLGQAVRMLENGAYRENVPARYGARARRHELMLTFGFVG